MSKNLLAKQIMQEAHKRAKTYEGVYSACLSLAMKEIHSEIKKRVGFGADNLPLIIEVETQRKEAKAKKEASKKQASVQPIEETQDVIYHTTQEYLEAHEKRENVSEEMQALIDKLFSLNRKYGGKVFNDNELMSIMPNVYNGGNDFEALYQALYYGRKVFYSMAKRYAYNDIYLSPEDVYCIARDNMMEKYKQGKLNIRKGLLQAFKGYVLNAVKTENSRAQRYAYDRFEAMASDEAKNTDTLMYDVAKALNNLDENDMKVVAMDLQSAFKGNDKLYKIAVMRMAGYGKREIEQAFAEVEGKKTRLDRQFQKVEAYFNNYFNEMKAY